MPRRHDPEIVVEWRCKDCGRTMQEGHAPSCRFAPPPRLPDGTDTSRHEVEPDPHKGKDEVVPDPEGAHEA